MQHLDLWAAACPTGTRARVLLAGLVLGLCGAAAAAPEISTIPVEVADGRELADLSLSELMSIEVTTVSRRAQPLRESAAAVFVVTGEELRRAGVRTLADALRFVPGLQVRRTSAQGYAVTSRGFSGDKLEVLLDGRSVYTPLTSTVFWDTLDTYLPDIDRIEVIRGPGATLWGANAMNGVINIVTRDARSSSGTEVRLGGGNEERAYGALRSVEKLGDDGAVRLFAKSQERGPSVNADGDDSWDGNSLQRAGFRYDGAPAPSQGLQLSGDVYHGRARANGFQGNGAPLRTHSESRGGFLQGAWSTHTASGNEWKVDGSYTGYELRYPTVFEERRHSGELGLQNQIALDGQTIVWGGGARVSTDKTGGAPLLLFFDPESRSLQKYNVYAQDQIRLGEGGELTLGSKFEHNSITGFEIQPGARLGWVLTPGVFTWGSVSRAVRTPNRLDSDVLIFCSFSALTNPPCTQGESTRLGNPELKSEKLIAYETGMRYWNDSFSVELAAFYNDYTDLRSTESGTAPFGTFDNKLEGHGYGGELTAAWTPLSWLGLQAFYGLLKIDVTPAADSIDQRSEASIEGGSPQQSAGLRVSVRPLSQLNVEGFLRYVDRLPAVNVPEYTELNLRTGWRVRPNLELALVGENLLNPSHPEASVAVELQRSVFLDLIWTLE